MKKLINILLVSGVIMGLIGGCSGNEGTSSNNSTQDNTTNTQSEEETAKDEKFVVGYTNLADTDVFCMTRENALKDLVKDDESLDLRFTDANSDISKQLDQIDNFIAQKVDAIIIVPVDYDGIVPGVESANEAGIPVIALGIESNGGDYCFIGSTNFDAGKMQGEYMAENLPENAQILYLEGQSGLYHSKERKEGFLEVLNDKRPDVTVLDSLDGKYVRDEAMRITEDWIQSYQKFDAIVAANDQMALGAIEALKVAGRLDGVMIAGVDGVPEALDAIENHEMALSVFQNGLAQGENAAKVLKELQKGNPLPDDIIIPFEAITSDNVLEYR